MSAWDGNAKTIGKLFAQAKNTHSFVVFAAGSDRPGVLNIYQRQRWTGRDKQPIYLADVPEGANIGDVVYVDQNEQLRVARKPRQALP